MEDISFSWTAPPVRALQKNVTRRDWKPAWAARFDVGDLLMALDKRREWGGNEIGVIRLTARPYLEHERDMPDEDYAGEGFEWLDNHPEYKPPKWAWTTMREHFYDSKLYGSEVWVVRFEPVEIYKPLILDDLLRERFAAFL